VTLFLIVTALINIALGYGLALYLGHAYWPHRVRVIEEASAEGAVDQLDEEAAIETPAPAHLPEPAPRPVGAFPEYAAAAPTAPQTAPAEGEAANSTKLEQDVLAGIEEFRNQLAQMKAQPGAVVPAEEAAAATV
jgi:hypothetical protein